jgi:hypothetical protein
MPSLPACFGLLLLSAACACRAQCALHDAPALAPVDSAARLGLAWSETALHPASGSLSEWEVTAALAPAPALSVGLRWAFAALSLPAGIGFGLEDPALDFGYRKRIAAWVLSAAGQASFPLGDAANGLGSGAFGLAGYLAAAWTRPAGSAGALLGIRGMSGSRASDMHMHMDMGDDVPLRQAYALAHPHADRELAYRVGWDGKRLGLALDGAHVLGAAMGAPGSDFLEGEAAWRFPIGNTEWKASLRLPLSPERRLGARLGLSAERAFPDSAP